MKKIICFGILSLHFFTVIQAQSGRIGFTAGTVVANYRVKAEGESKADKSKTGFTAGIIADLPLSKKISLQPAAHFIQKGTKDKQTYNGSSYKMSLNINMVEFPLQFMYHANSPYGNFFIGAGPAVGICISGKLRVKTDTESTKETVSFGKGQSDLLRYTDFGITATTGYCFPNGLLFAIGFNQGLSNLEPQPAAGESLKSHYISVRLGWMLKNSKQIR